jgi:hypothetical protein
MELIAFGRQNQLARVSIFQTNSAGERIPLFKYHLQPNGLLADVIAIPISEAFRSSSALSEFQMVEEVRFSPPHVGDVLTAYGFPDLHPTWPYFPPHTNAGPFAKVKGIMYMADMPTQHGHSGGPVFMSDGSFIGICIGSDDLAAIVPSATILALTGPFTV